MISIIICSVKKDERPKVEANIKTTIGDIKYEVLWIDNTENRYSIFQAYEEGTRKAQYKYLCFMHEDIVFHSQDWGRTCIKRMEEDENIGMLGVAGGQFVSRISDGWWSMLKMRKGRIIQGFSAQGEQKIREDIFDSDWTHNQVVAIDGLWMLTKKEVFDKGVYWDTVHYKGFHFYDLDFSIQIVEKGYRIEIIPVIIEHRSGGMQNPTFWDNYLSFHQKWNHFLPVHTSNITQDDIKEYEDSLVGEIVNLNKTVLEQKGTIWKLRTQLSKTGYYKIQRILSFFKNKH